MSRIGCPSALPHSRTCNRSPPPPLIVCTDAESVAAVVMSVLRSGSVRRPSVRPCDVCMIRLSGCSSLDRLHDVFEGQRRASRGRAHGISRGRGEEDEARLVLRDVNGTQIPHRRPPATPAPAPPRGSPPPPAPRRHRAAPSPAAARRPPHQPRIQPDNLL